MGYIAKIWKQPKWPSISEYTCVCVCVCVCVCKCDWALKIISCQWFTPINLATWEAEIGRIMVWGPTWAIISYDHISKMIISKWSAGVAQVVEHLLCECLFCKCKPWVQFYSNKKKKKKVLLCATWINTCDIMLSQIGRKKNRYKSWMVVYKCRGRREWALYLMSTEFYFYKLKTVMEINSSDSSTKLWIYLRTLSCTLKMVKMINFITCVLLQLRIKKKPGMVAQPLIPSWFGGLQDQGQPEPYRKILCQRKEKRGIPRWWLEVGAESMLPKVKSWRDAGETLCRKNHQEEAKLQLLHTPRLRIASPLHVKQRNQEGSCTASFVP
jgi:hypothetical protein